MPNNLAREQLLAFSRYLQIAQEDFVRLQDNCRLLKQNNALLNTDFRAISVIPFDKTSLPRESHWSWNQSNAKICVRGDDGSLVTFRKISPRKRYSNLTAPNFKIWLFHVQKMSDMISQELHFLWCEKGTAPITNGIHTEIGLVFPEQLTLNSFAFLAPFVDSSLATELGW